MLCFVEETAMNYRFCLLMGIWYCFLQYIGKRGYICVFRNLEKIKSLIIFTFSISLALMKEYQKSLCALYV